MQIWDNETILKNQKDGEIIGQVLTLKESMETKPNWNEISKLSPKLKAYWFLWEQLQIKDHILFRKWEAETTKETIWQLVLPSVMREPILKELHSSITGGHLGEHKVLAKAWQRYFGHGMKDDIQAFCKQCTVCAQKKPPHKKNKAPFGAIHFFYFSDFCDK